MKEVIIGILDIMTIVTTIVMYKSGSRTDRVPESSNRLNIDIK